MELADGVIEAAQGRRARAPRAHRCTGRSRTTPSAHSATFFGSCKMPNSSILPWGKALVFQKFGPGKKKLGASRASLLPLFFIWAGHGAARVAQGVRRRALVPAEECCA